MTTTPNPNIPGPCGRYNCDGMDDSGLPCDSSPDVCAKYRRLAQEARGRSHPSKPLSTAEIEELWELEAKATKGPWAFSPYGDENKYGVGVVMDGQDNAVEGFDDSEDGIVVESVAPEVEGHANARLIATMRNALPRLLAMLQPPSDANSGGLNECPVCKRMVESKVHCKHCNAHMEPWLWHKNPGYVPPAPSDAAVLEAVEEK